MCLTFPPHQIQSSYISYGTNNNLLSSHYEYGDIETPLPLKSVRTVQAQNCVGGRVSYQLSGNPTFSSSRRLAAKLLESGRYRGHWRCCGGWLCRDSDALMGAIRGNASVGQENGEHLFIYTAPTHRQTSPPPKKEMLTEEGKALEAKLERVEAKAVGRAEWAGTKSL